MATVSGNAAARKEDPTPKSSGYCRILWRP